MSRPTFFEIPYIIPFYFFCTIRKKEHNLIGTMIPNESTCRRNEIISQALTTGAPIPPALLEPYPAHVDDHNTSNLIKGEPPSGSGPPPSRPPPGSIGPGLNLTPAAHRPIPISASGSRRFEQGQGQGYGSDGHGNGGYANGSGSGSGSGGGGAQKIEQVEQDFSDAEMSDG